MACRTACARSRISPTARGGTRARPPSARRGPWRPPATRNSPCRLSAAPAAATVASDQVSVSRGSSARLVSGSTLAAPPATRATMGVLPASASTTTWFALRPHGTRAAVPLSFQPAPSRRSESRSAAWVGATVIGPIGTSRPADASSQAPIMVSAMGSGTAKRPAALRTTCASSQEPPAPPCCSGICGRVRPPSSTACQSASGHWPFSAASIKAGVTRSVKRRVQVSARRFRISAMSGPFL